MQASLTSVSSELQLTKKVAAEKVPSMAPWSGKSQTEDATHGVERSTEYRARGNPDEEVSKEDRITAYAVRRPISPLP